MLFNTRLREMRKYRGITQQKMADYLGLGLRSYQHYEEGSREPSLDSLLKIGEVLNIPIDYLLGRDEFLKSLGVSVDEYQ